MNRIRSNGVIHPADSGKHPALSSASILQTILPGADHEETHLSHIFLTENEVFKLKKAVNLPFADFSTIGRRHAACAEELEVNRDSGADLYEGIVPLVERNGVHSIGGDGTTVDWLVRMHRFPDKDRGDHAMASGQITAEMLQAFVDHLYRRHELTPRELGTDWSETLRLTLRNVAHALLDESTNGPFREQVKHWQENLDRRLRTHSSILRLRSEQILSGTHGDLHLKNLCIFRGKLIAYDALEFDAALTKTDPLYDVAFLIADLWHRGHGLAANAVMNRYLGLASAYEAAPLVPLYTSLRCGIRALAEAMSGRGREAEAYLLSAKCFLASPEPLTILIAGRSGTGKSTLARQIAPTFSPPPGAVHMRSDVIRKRMHGLWPEDRLPSSAYASWERDTVYEEVHTAASKLQGEMPLILDVALAGSGNAQAIERLADCKLWLTAPDDVLSTRLNGRTDDASDATSEVLPGQRQDPPGENWIVIDASRSLEETTGKINQALDEYSASRTAYDPHQEV